MKKRFIVTDIVWSARTKDEMEKLPEERIVYLKINTDFGEYDQIREHLEDLYDATVESLEFIAD